MPSYSDLLSVSSLLDQVFHAQVFTGPVPPIYTRSLMHKFRKSFCQPVGQATSAAVRIEGASQPVTIRALNDSANLFEGSIGHSGVMDFQVSGTTEKQISLRHRNNISEPFSFNITEMLKWDIGLNPKVPVTLNYDGASGSSQLNLGGLQLTNLSVDGGSGSLRINLPASAKPYAVMYKGASGSMWIRALRAAANCRMPSTPTAGPLSWIPSTAARSSGWPG